MREIPSAYNPKATEEKWYKLWESRKSFHAEPDPERKPYTIVIPPPNITGILHMGHALNNTVQDILIRWRRMQGRNAEWLPGTDHAGIATQNVVEKMLAKEGIKRDDLGREKFIERVWKWRDQYGSTIISQLKRLGCSCDWDRTRFTMDEGLSNAVVEAFIRLYEKGLIYRGNYIINWCPRCRTALSDEEAQHKDLKGFLYYIKYPVKGGNGHVTVATTRPETMLGDVAVAVNPEDARYKNLIGGTLMLPLMNREIKVIADDIVDPAFGTGAVKVTPAHDPNDFEIGKRHNLEPVVVMDPDGTMSKNAGDYAGMDRFEAREAILEDLKEMKLLEKVDQHAHSVGHCYRCHTVVEPYLSEQWFVKMKPLAKAAIEAAKSGKIKFYPDRWTKVYLDWMENIRDWCISRQIWWGHRIPVYYCAKCQNINVSRNKPAKCSKCGSNEFRQDEDVLDTWFSSWLWPFSTFGWPEKTKDLAYFYPTSALVTAQEIIFFWVARMIMAGYEFMGEAPFKDIYIHGTVRDQTGAKMSKSLGNVIDPIEVIDEFGADALRFSIISITAAGQDVFLSKEKFQLGRNFANKIWNAARFVTTNLSEDVDTDLCVLYKNADLTLADRWILSNFYSTLQDLDKALESYRFNEAANLLYDFIWHKYCDWYLEITKNRIKEKNAQIILYKVLEKSLRLLHPIMPFITEEIWGSLPHKRESIMTQPWPHLQKDLIDKKTESDMDLAIGIISTIRNIRAEVNIQPQKLCKVIVAAGSGKSRGAIDKSLDYIKDLARLESFEVVEKLKRPKACSVAVFGDCEICVPLDGLVDIEAEKKKTMSKIGELEKYVKSVGSKLSNKDFADRAPKEIVDKEKEKLAEAKASLEKLKENLKRLEN